MIPAYKFRISARQERYWSFLRMLKWTDWLVMIYFDEEQANPSCRGV